LIGIITGLVLNCFIKGADGIFFSLSGFSLGVALLFFPFAAGGMGAGDVKLLGMIGLFKGTGFVFPVFLLSALLGGLFSAVVLAKQGKLLTLLKEILMFFLSGFRMVLLPSFVRDRGVFPGEATDKHRIPYGPALVLAALLVYFLPFFSIFLAFPQH